jgi:two-component system cell cycle sensor histidine kinase/response regulator CckA
MARDARRVGDAVLDDDRMTPDMQRLVQELQLRQIELENQNQELKRARIEVEEGVSRYTQLQVQLAESHKLEAIGTLAGGIAHDFNNILTGLLGELSVLDLKLAQDDASRIYVEDALELVNRGADLTKQLLAFACHAKSDVTPLDLARVVSKTSAMFGRTRKEIEIQLDFPAGLMAVLIDRTQLEQVLLNLFINAAQAMPRGGRLLLRARNAELAEGEVAPFGIPPGLFVKFSITDTGVGMDTATLARIFEPFFTTKGPGLGSGLGLASVHGIIKSHAGFITVESEIGKGTTFSVFLAGTDQSVAEEKTPGAAIVHGSGTILVVDDEQHVLKALTRLLETIGYDALTASSGREAVEIVRRQGLGISLVILDMIMPEMSGGQTYDALRKIAPGIKVLLASGYRLDVQAEALLVQGCAGFIQKPFDLATLSAELQKIQSSSKRRGDVLS